MSAQRDQFLERPLPYSPEAERAILGGIILDNELMAQVAEVVVPDQFYVPSHRRVYAAMLALFEKGSEINPILIGEELRREGLLEQSGGVAEISNLTYGLPHFTKAQHFVDLIQNSATLRGIVKAGNKMISAALEAEEPAQAVLEAAERSIFDLSQDKPSEGFSYIGEAADEAIALAELRSANDSHLNGVTSGLVDLDAMTAGWQPGDLVIVAGRASMGKTALSLAFAEAATKDPAAVLLFCSLEMPKAQIANRMLCSRSRVDSTAFRAGRLNRTEWARIAEGRAELGERKLILDNTPGMTLMQLRAKIRRASAKEKRLDLVMVDYLQLMTGAGRSESRQVEVAGISRGLKAIALEFNIPVIALSQLSRAPENRSDKRPQLADLRESGAIEMDADIVGLLYREEYYNKTSDNLGQAEFIIAKHRNGPTGTVKLAFISEFARFENMYREKDSEEVSGRLWASG